MAAIAVGDHLNITWSIQWNERIEEEEKQRGDKKSSAAITAKYNQTVIIDESDSHTGERDAQWKRNQPKTKEEEIQKSHSQTSKIFKIQSWIVPMIKTTIAHYPAIFVQYPNTYTHTDKRCCCINQITILTDIEAKNRISH